MILVDSRESKDTKGSPGLWEDLKKTKIPLSQTTLDFGDLMFVGNGPEGDVTIGVEFKKIRDLLNSIRTKRLVGHQLVGMQQYDFRYLLIEGDWRADDAGRVCVRAGHSLWRPVPGHMAASELRKTLIGLPLRAGVITWPTSNRKETVAWLSDLYHSWTDKAWEQHQSHTAIYHPPTLVPISDVRKMISTLPGIGTKTSLLVEKHFTGSIHKMVNAPIHEWSKIDGIGLKTAETIHAFLRGK